MGKTTSKGVAALAGKVMGGYLPTLAEAKRLAATALAQTVKPSDSKRK